MTQGMRRSERSLKKKIKEEELDGLIITEPHNVFYLTGSRVEGTGLVTQEESFLIVSPVFAEEAKRELGGWEIVVHAGRLDEALERIWKKRGSRLGFETSNLSYDEYQRLSRIKNIELIPCRGWV